MPPPPKVFISASRGDLRTVRSWVKEALSAMGCEPVEDAGSEPDRATAETMLRAKMGECQALIHIAGARYGAEPDPATLPAGVKRQSFAQLEYAISRELQAEHGEERFRVFTFVCPASFPFDQTEPDGTPLAAEPYEQQASQFLYFLALMRADGMVVRPRDLPELQAGVQALRDELITLPPAEAPAPQAPAPPPTPAPPVAVTRKPALQPTLLPPPETSPPTAPASLPVRKRRRTLAACTAVLLVLAVLIVAALKRDTAPPENQPQPTPSTPAIAVGGSPRPSGTPPKRDQNKVAPAEPNRPPTDPTRTMVEELAQAQQLQDTESDELTPAQKSERIRADLAAKHGLKPEELRAAMETWAARVLADPKTSAYDRALAEYQANHFDAAAAQASIAYEEALKKGAGGQAEALTAARLEGHAARETIHAEAALAAYQKAAALVDRERDPIAWANEERWVAEALFHMERYQETEEALRAIVAARESKSSKPTAELASALNSLAMLLEATNRLTEAEPLIQRALEIDQQALGSDDPAVARDLHRLSLLLSATDRLPAAEAMMKRALEIDEKAYGPAHPTVARDLHHLALVLYRMNSLAEAEPLMQRALAIDEKAFGQDHPSVARELSNLAQLMKATNRQAEAEPLMRRALEIDQKAYGQNHPTVAADLNNLASLLHAANRLAEAEPLVEQAVKIDEKVYGPNHPTVAIDLNTLGSLYYAAHRLTEAEPLMRRALAIDEKAYGKDHPTVAIRLSNLASLLYSTHRLAEAEPLMRRVLEIDEKASGPDHPTVAIRLNNLAMLLLAANRPSEAEPLSRRAVGILLHFTATTGHRHPHLIADIGNYLTICAKMNLPGSDVRAQLEKLRADAKLDPDAFREILRDERNASQ